MARTQEKIHVPAHRYVELTDGDAEAVSFQVKKGEIDLLRADSTQPSKADLGWGYSEKEGERDLPLSAISVGAVGNRLWAISTEITGSTVLVDHA